MTYICPGYGVVYIPSAGHHIPLWHHNHITNINVQQVSTLFSIPYIIDIGFEAYNTDINR